MRPPNLLLIVADQHRADVLGCAGHPDARTPHLDRLAGQGVRFTQCWANSPVCAPNRTCLQTGLYPAQHRVFGNSDVLDLARGSGFAEALGAAGYRTGFIGKAHWDGDDPPALLPPVKRPGHVSQDRRLGWQHWLGFNHSHHHYDMPLTHDREGGGFDRPYTGHYEPELMSRLALDFVGKSSAAPWCLQVNYGPPHQQFFTALWHEPGFRQRAREVDRELGLGLPEAVFNNYSQFVETFPQHLVASIVPEEFLRLFPEEALTLPRDASTDHPRAARLGLREYLAAVASVDAAVGQLVGGVPDDTIVLYTSDHGDSLWRAGVLPRSKGLPLQSSCRVPLIVWSPGGRVARGCVCDAVVSTVDITATLLACAGADAAASRLPGRSFARLLAGGGDSPGGETRRAYMSFAEWRAISDGEYFFASVLKPNGLVPLRLSRLKDDPSDLCNLVDDPAYASAKARLMAELRAAMERAGESPARSV
jgi:arylsulfatase